MVSPLLKCSTHLPNPHPHGTLAAESRPPSRLHHNDSTPCDRRSDADAAAEEAPPPEEPLQEGVSRRCLGEDGASLSGSLVDLDSSSRVDGGSPPPALPEEPVMSSTEQRYHEIIASRLVQLELPVGVGDEGSDLAGSSNIPSIEILEALTRKSIHDDDSRAALVQCQIQNFLKETQERDRDSGKSDSVAVVAEPDKITLQQHKIDCGILMAGRTEIDTYTELDQEQTNKLHLKYALYRIKACLLLKGKPVDELDDVALERKYPPELIEKNNSSFITWMMASLGGDEYASWSEYRAFYSTPEADRDYLQYWETIVKEIKWLEQYLLIDQSSIEWAHLHSKARYQAMRIASGFSNMTLELVAVGLQEYIWTARIHLVFVKDLDGVFYEIWRRVNNNHQLRFRDALKQVYDENLFSAQHNSMKYELEYSNSKMEQKFHRCTKGISDSVPEYKARELIAQEIRWKRASLSGTYERYARKKLKIAELIGLIIPKDKIVAA